ncbi:penicillin-binding protein [Clostridium botulinum]|uniref:penicillin-binding transpeptidase domain-containing protein n=1 Tax=Clostridium botulinum TaxID=1491 RepID=UPI00052D7EE5|nr:penicillin-binding transpeptidase domain-containing protein [Clostridium botulinum]KGM94879.1 penicillin-binding protein [Clostridium botulinum D str. CCUG 7971]NFO98034.1 penicillin-binding protein [Clostridium botulinum]OOV50835.1 penicillin-binding protein [Clostridium botulinum D/C]OOV53880.1 penicillin-binding protein [Clostridium botulinum D/C]OOV55701.1 penicillin-binding protein [Clostridium botulinum D/C]
MINVENNKRCYIILIVFILLFMILAFRIVGYNYFGSKNLAVMAENQYQYKEKASELNYLLLDNKGRNLLQYKDNYYAVIDPYTYLTNNYYVKKDELKALKILLKNCNKNYDIDNEVNINKSSKIIWNIDESTYNNLKKIKGVNGFYVYKYLSINKENAYWSIENLITNINKNLNGVWQKKSKDCIETDIYNKTEKNEYVYRIFDKDVNGKINKEFTTDPTTNVNVRLTLDKILQENIKKILNEKNFNKYDQIGVVLMETDTGKIRAMVQKDDSKPNINIGASTQNGFFAGSILKSIVEEAGIKNNNISLNHKYKHRNFGGLFEEHEDHKDKNIEQAFTKSSNNIFVQVGIDVGIKKFDELSKEHGLYEKVLGFEDEQNGILELNVKTTPDDSGDSLQAYIGQKTRITPIEAISIPNTIVNGGIYVKPQLIEAYVDKNNNIIEKCHTCRKTIISKINSNIMKNQMLNVVKEGTGKNAYIKDIEIGGKTGTSNRVENTSLNNNKKDLKEYCDGWFTGFFKLNDKYYSMVVFVENIGKDVNASGSAVPVFKKIIEENYNYINKF